jgi:hypothetical protein
MSHCAIRPQAGGDGETGKRKRKHETMSFQPYAPEMATLVERVRRQRGWKHTTAVLNEALACHLIQFANKGERLAILPLVEKAQQFGAKVNLANN